MVDEQLQAPITTIKLTYEKDCLGSHALVMSLFVLILLELSQLQVFLWTNIEENGRSDFGVLTKICKDA